MKTKINYSVGKTIVVIFVIILIGFVFFTQLFIPTKRMFDNGLTNEVVILQHLEGSNFIKKISEDVVFIKSEDYWDLRHAFENFMVLHPNLEMASQPFQTNIGDTMNMGGKLVFGVKFYIWPKITNTFSEK